MGGVSGSASIGQRLEGHRPSTGSDDSTGEDGFVRQQTRRPTIEHNATKATFDLVVLREDVFIEALELYRPSWPHPDIVFDHQGR